MIIFLVHYILEFTRLLSYLKELYKIVFFQNTTSQGPTHLIRMEFILKEQIFYRNIKEIEKELNLETRALNKNENFSEIIDRNKVNLGFRIKVFQNKLKEIIVVSA